MLKNILDKLPITTILVSYFFICGGLYIIGFWSTFNIDITPFVSIIDIPKSFVLPFAISQGIFLLQMLTNLLTSTLVKDDPETDTTTPKKKKTKWERLFFVLFRWDTLFIISTILIINFSRTYKTNAIFWSMSSLLIGIYLTYKFTSILFVREKIPYYNLRLYFGYIICFLPVFCFSTGKVLSLNIYNNQEIMYIHNIRDNNHSGNIPSTVSKRDSNSLKFIGFLGDKLIVSSVDNKRIIFINQSSFNQVEMTRK